MSNCKTSQSTGHIPDHPVLPSPMHEVLNNIQISEYHLISFWFTNYFLITKKLQQERESLQPGIGYS